MRRGLGLGYRYCKCRALEILFQYLSDLVLKVLFKCPGSKNFCTEKIEEIRNNFPLIAGSRFVFYYEQEVVNYSYIFVYFDWDRE